MAKGPLSVDWGGYTIEPAHAGALGAARVAVTNSGTQSWGKNIFFAYHWLDLRGNPIVWDGLRSEVPPLAPGGQGSVAASVRAPLPPGPYRLAFDLVAEGRAWFSELGGDPLSFDVQVSPRAETGSIDLPAGVVPAADWDERVRSAHAEGYAVVAGAIQWEAGRRPRELEAYEPGRGRRPDFSAPLICPSTLPEAHLERLADVAGLPAYAAPADEPWVYDGRIVLHVRKP